MNSPDELEQIARLLGGEAFVASVRAALARPPAPAAAARWQDPLITELVPKGARVLDLGCGGGETLERLARSRGARVQGVELDVSGVLRCVERGVPVLQADLDAGLKGFADGSFDVVVLEETVQTLHHPTKVLDEMLRVGRLGIVSFPNMGHWRLRLELLAGGRMPSGQHLPHPWDETPNIHLLTIADFRDWCDAHGVVVVHGWCLVDGRPRPWQDGDNLLAEEALFAIARTA